MGPYNLTDLPYHLANNNRTLKWSAYGVNGLEMWILSKFHTPSPSPTLNDNH